MFLREIEFKNIGSYGNKLQKLSFSREGELIELRGRSGAGKSTLLSLPSLLFYGKTIGNNKSSIANRTNRNGYVKGIIEVRDKVYIIERGFTPTYLKLYEQRGEEIIDLENIGAKDGQNFIEENIMPLTQAIFNSIISLNLNTFKSFISLSPMDKKAIIDKLFNLEIINEIYKSIKEQTKEVNQTIARTQASNESLSRVIEKTKLQIEELKSKENIKKTDLLSDKIIKVKKDLIEDLNKELKDLKEKNVKDTKTYNDFNEKGDIFGKVELEIQKRRLEKTNLIKNIDEKIKLFENEKCPLCGSSFKTDSFDEIRMLLSNKRKEAILATQHIEEQYTKLNERKAEYEQKKGVLMNVLNTNQSKIYQVNESIRNIEYELYQDVEKRNSLVNVDLNPLYQIIESTKNDINKQNNEMKLFQNKFVGLSILEDVYSENGVKKEIMGSYIPFINKEISESLQKFSFPYRLEFDSLFNAHLYSLKEEIAFSTLSAGELKRTDIAILCALLKLVKRQYPEINFVGFDETLSSIDIQTGNDIVRFIKDFAMEEKLNVFIVSHNVLNSECIDKTFEVEKKGSFSEFVVL